mgnify:CR=1 FL=1
MEKLIYRCQQGDREALGQLYTAMHNELLNQCRKYVANESTAEDLLHDAFLIIFTNIGKLRSPEKARQWMRKVVKNVCLLYVQNRQNRESVSIDQVRETALGAVPEIGISYEDILSAIDQLPRGYRQVFRLSVLEGLTHQQIADLLSIEPHTSSSQLLRARRQLRHMLQLLMLLLLVAIPYGIYRFFLPSQADKPEATQKTALGKPSEEKHSDEAEVFADASVKDSRKILTAEPSARRLSESETITDTVATVANLPMSDVPVKTSEKRKDTFEINENEQDLIAEKSKAEKVLNLSLAYSGIPDGTARQLPYGAEGMNGEIDSVTHHRMPITVSLSARYRFSPRLWLDGGLCYTFLSSETKVGNTYLNMEQQQRVHYLGLSVGIGYELWRYHRLNLYTTGSVSFELPLGSSLKKAYLKDGRLIDSDDIHINPHAQWAMGAGVGLQYNLTPAIGFFIEPSLQYYFRNSDGVDTWRSAHPLTPLLPLGIRIDF